jgi:hypothetical protein
VIEIGKNNARNFEDEDLACVANNAAGPDVEGDASGRVAIGVPLWRDSYSNRGVADAETVSYAGRNRNQNEQPQIS